VRARALAPLALAVSVLAAPSATAAPVDPPPATPPTVGASAHAAAIVILVPGQDPVGTATADSSAGTVAPTAPFAYPADAPVVQADAASAATSADETDATASADLAGLSLFGGEITADAVAARARAGVEQPAPTGDFGDSALTNLVVQGQAVQPAPNLRVELGWGHATVLEEATSTGTADAPSFEASVIALDVVLDADHGGLPAGTQILVGQTDAAATVKAELPPPPVVTVNPEPPSPPPAPPPPPPPPPSPTAPNRPPGIQRETEPKAKAFPKPRPQPVAKPKARPAPKPKASRPSPSPTSLPKVYGPTFPPAKYATGNTSPPEPKKRARNPFAPVFPPPDVSPKLTAGGYVFPVYGPSSYSDTFGAPRADVTYHHGDDIFAPLGAPLLAVADGTVFSVGWNDIGGNRLWLRDSRGNQFYYAHLSAFSTLAVNGAHVHAGDVLGFVGNTGDAEGTPYHLHFEVHPVAMLFLGYDGAVDPTPYLDAWRHVADVRIRPAVTGGPPVAPVSKAPAPGAILLQSSDISSASGLDPGSLQRALAPARRHRDEFVSTGGSRPGAR
jgi:murein DD-endopeptidase MepM/ murein hydrolase activator NlpD